MMNVTKQTIDAVQEMVHESFLANSRLDRIQSVLNTKFAYNNLADLVHKNMAHAYATKFGDGSAETIEGYNIAIEYGNIPKQAKEYFSVKECIDEILEITLDYQNKLNMCYKIAMDNMDVHVGADLIDLIEDHNDFVRQAILLKDKIDLYGDNPSYDVHVYKFWILGD